MADTTSFPKFSELPIELRLKIWKDALPGPRIVYLKAKPLVSYECARIWSDRDVNSHDLSFFDTDEMITPMIISEMGEGDDGEENHDDEQEEDNEENEDEALPRYGYHSRGIVPLLYVCRESHEVAASLYSQAFGTESAFPQTYFNFDLDTLYIDFSHLKSIESVLDFGEDFRKVQKLAIFNDRTEMETPRDYDILTWQHGILKSFGNLKFFYMVPSHESLRFSEDTTELVFMDVLNVQSALTFFDEPHSPERRDVYLSKQELYFEKVKSLYCMNILSTEHSELDDRYRQDLPEYSLPHVDLQMVTTAAIKTKLETLELAIDFPPYQSSYQGQVIVLRLQFSCDRPGEGNDFSQRVRLYRDSDTLMYIVIFSRCLKWYRQRWRTILLYCDGEELELASLATEYDIDDGDVIDVYLRDPIFNS